MIGVITKGSCFSGCVEYVLALKEENKEARLLYSEGLLTDTPKDIVDGFECQRHLNSRVQHWCGHISLSYSPEDSARLSDEAMVKLALEYMEKMGIKNTQFIIARHLDKEHPHCHIVYNRVDNNGKCVSDSYEYYRSNAICKELKKKYGLTFGENKDKVKVDRLKGRSKTRQEIYLAIQAAKRTAKDWTSFQRELAQKGISVRKKFRRGTTEVEGLSYIKDGQKFKASQVDRDGKCSYKVICNALDRNKNSQAQPSASAPRPMQQQPKQTPSTAVKIIEAGADIAESLGNAVGGLFQVGPAYDQDEEAFIREMNRRKKEKKRQKFVTLNEEKMKTDFENSPENFLQNIAEDLSAINGTCTEIKESQLSCATFIWQEARIEQARISDIKYHYILMHGGVNSEGLDSIQSWFRDPERVKQIEDEVKAYEDRVQVIALALAKQETARALDQKQRLEEKINELNSKTNPKSNRK